MLQMLFSFAALCTTKKTVLRTVECCIVPPCTVVCMIYAALGLVLGFCVLLHGFLTGDSLFVLWLVVMFLSVVSVGCFEFGCQYQCN